MDCRTYFTAILARLRGIGGRSRRIEQKLDCLIELTRNMELNMADDANEVLARLEELKTQVNDRTTQLGQQLAKAHQDLADAEARGRSAQKAEDEQAAAADKQAALDKIKEISDGLVAFEASGN